MDTWGDEEEGNAHEDRDNTDESDQEMNDARTVSISRSETPDREALEWQNRVIDLIYQAFLYKASIPNVDDNGNEPSCEGRQSSLKSTRRTITPKRLAVSKEPLTPESDSDEKIVKDFAASASSHYKPPPESSDSEDTDVPPDTRTTFPPGLEAETYYYDSPTSTDAISWITDFNTFENMFCVYVHYSYGAPLHEIIQFAAVHTKIKTGNIVNQFSRVVKPTKYPELTRYCIQSTDITQDEIIEADTLENCLTDFKYWINELPDVQLRKNSVFACWGKCEVEKIISECSRLNISQTPLNLAPWYDIKETFDSMYLKDLKTIEETKCPTALGMTVIDKNFTEEGRSALHAANNMIKVLHAIAYPTNEE